MPKRRTPLVNNEIYHVFNRSVALQPIFKNTNDYRRGLEIIDYYRFNNPPKRYSHYNRMSIEDKIDLLDSLHSSYKKLIDIYSFSLMPNHYHFVVKQLIDGGISKYLRLFQNSYAKYLNVKSDRSGAVFQQMFKVVRIETDEQFLHVTRYVHLNPLTSYIIKQKEDINSYLWNSYMDYYSTKPRQFIETAFLNGFFKRKNDFVQFTFDHLDYQRKLESIKHLLHE